MGVLKIRDERAAEWGYRVRCKDCGAHAVSPLPKRCGVCEGEHFAFVCTEPEGD